MFRAAVEAQATHLTATSRQLFASLANLELLVVIAMKVRAWMCPCACMYVCVFVYVSLCLYVCVFSIHICVECASLFLCAMRPPISRSTCPHTHIHTHTPQTPRNSGWRTAGGSAARST